MMKSPQQALVSIKEMIEGKDLNSSLRGTALSWFEAHRSSSILNWQENGLPTRQNEEWKYTSVTSLSESRWTQAPKVSSKDVASIHKATRLHGAAAAEVVFVNGHFSAELSTTSKVTGLHAGSLSSFLKNGDKKVQKALSDSEKIFASEKHLGKESTFAALNSTLFEEAIVIYVEPNTQVKDPVVVTFISTASAKGVLQVAQPRVLAIFDRNSESAVIENYFGDGEYFNNCVTDGYLAEGARVSYVKNQNENVSGSHIATTRFTLSRDARLESLQLSLGGKLSRQDLKIALTAPGAEAVVDGLYIESGKQHVDNHTSIEHLVGDTQSEQLYKGILDDESRAVFNGRIFIAQDAQRSNSSQLNNNLLLSKKAEVDTKPELEIFADDVKAGHGATIGRLDPEHLFYLRSRAISEKDAVAMLALGFANDLVLRRKSAAVREMLAAPVANAVVGLKVHA